MDPDDATRAFVPGHTTLCTCPPTCMFFFSDSLDQKSMLAGHEMRGYLFDQRHGDATLHIQTWCWTSGPAENVAHTTTCPLWSSPDFALVTALPVCLTWTSYYVSRHWSSPPRHDFSAACHRGRGESDRAPQSSFAGVITKKTEQHWALVVEGESNCAF